MNSALLINPFQRIAGGLALVIGLVSMLLGGYLAHFNGVHFPDLTKIEFTVTTGWYVPMVELTTGWLFLFLISIVTFLCFGIRHFRVIDLLGTIAFAGLPYFFIVLLGFAYNEFGAYRMIVQTFFYLPFGLSVLWLFNALITCGNIKGNKRYLVFFLVVGVSELLIHLSMSKIYLIIL